MADGFAAGFSAGFSVGFPAGVLAGVSAGVSAGFVDGVMFEQQQTEDYTYEFDFADPNSHDSERN